MFIKGNISEIIIFIVNKFKHLYPLWLGGYPKNTQGVDRGANLCGAVTERLGKHRHPKILIWSYEGILRNKTSAGVLFASVLVGKILTKYVSVSNESTQ